MTIKLSRLRILRQASRIRRGRQEWQKPIGSFYSPTIPHVQKNCWILPEKIFKLHIPSAPQGSQLTTFAHLNFKPMVQADIAQLSGECTGWRETLRNFREEFNQCKNRLQQLTNNSLSKDDLTQVEHYQNQFHIQLINIHDLKQSIKQHDRRVNFEVESLGGVTNETLAGHENLFDQYQQLDQTLSDLKKEFDDFSRLRSQ